MPAFRIEWSSAKQSAGSAAGTQLSASHVAVYCPIQLDEPASPAILTIVLIVIGIAVLLVAAHRIADCAASRRPAS